MITAVSHCLVKNIMQCALFHSESNVWSFASCPPCQVKDVLQCARHEALALGHPYIGTKHILLGILREEEGKAKSLLKEMGVNLRVVRQAVIEHVPTHRMLGAKIDALPITTRARQILGVTVEEARNIDSAEIGTEHLLLALLKDPDSAASKILAPMGVNYGRIRHALA